MNYYGRFCRSQLYPLLQRINTYLMRWARKKYRRLRAFKTVQGMVDRADRSRAQPVRALGMDGRVLAGFDEKSGVNRETVTLRSVGARG